MTQLLEKAFAKASRLPDAEQDALAAVLLSEMESEARWQKSFAESADKLAALADEALADLDAGRTEPLDPDHL
ncbi:MAG TPA: hypothetical protein VNE39_27170 [Planctomycetota bacterium]|nr:hypothetical protein [Planctomycetota bacterium]